MKKKWVKFGIIYASLILICIVMIYIIPTLQGALEKTYVVKHGNIEMSHEAEATVFRDEVVYVAPNATTVERLAKDGELVRAGQQVVSLSGSGSEEVAETYKPLVESLADKATKSEAGKTTVTGYVSYKVDGAEYALSSKSMPNISKGDMSTNASLDLQNCIKGKCAGGEPLFKITANGDWWLVYYVSNDDAKQYEEGMEVNLQIEDEPIKAEVVGIKKGKTKTRIALCADVFVKNYLTARNMDIKVITSRADGLVLENTSFIECKGNTGVIRKNKLGYKEFVRVLPLATDGEKSTVYENIFMDQKGNYVETIKVYDEILTKPSKKDLESAISEKK